MDSTVERGTSAIYMESSEAKEKTRIIDGEQKSCVFNSEAEMINDFNITHFGEVITCVVPWSTKEHEMGLRWVYSKWQ